MRNTGRLLFLGLILSASSLQAQYTDVINSNRPGESMSAFSVGKTVLQAEMGVTGTKQHHDLYESDLTGVSTELVLRYGAFFEQLEFIGELTYDREKIKNPTSEYERNGLRQAYLGAKFLVFDPHKKFDDKPNLYSWNANHKFKWRDLLPAVAVYAGANLKLAKDFPPFNQQRMSGRGMIMTQNQLGRYVFVTNFYMDRFSSNNETMGYVATLTYGINPDWSAFIENQGFQADYYADFILRGGAAYLLAGNMQVDASFGVSVKDTPSVLNFGIGFSWRFDELYEDVFLRLPGEDKGEKDKKDKKKKKRKDEVETEPAKSE